MELEEFFAKTECTIIENSIVNSSIDNSTLLSSPSVAVNNVLSGVKRLNCAVTLVEIQGGTNEPDHYHSSHVLGLIVEGKGILRYVTQEGEKKDHELSVGGLVIIPRGALHYFYTADSSVFKWIAFEFSDQDIDYQKHYTL